MTAWMLANLAPIMFTGLVVFLLLGFPVAFSLAACGLFFAQMRPSWAAMIVRAMDSPSPMPRWVVVKNDSNSSGMRSAGMPQPQSRTTTSTPCVS